MSDKKTPEVNVGIPVEREEYFEDKLYKVLEQPHPGFRTPAMASDPSLAERDDLALSNMSDKELAGDLYRLGQYLALPSTIYYAELLKAANQRIKFLSGRLERVEGKEIFDVEVTSQQAVKDMVESNLSMTEVRPEVSRISKSKVIDIAPGDWDGDKIRDPWSLAADLRAAAPKFDPAMKMADIQSGTVSISVSGPGTENLVKEGNVPDQPYLLDIGGMYGYNHPVESLMISDNYLITCQETRLSLDELAGIYAQCKTILERLFFRLELHDKDNLGQLTHRMVTKHGATCEQVFIVLRAAGIGNDYVTLKEAKKRLKEVKELVDLLYPPYGGNRYEKRLDVNIAPPEDLVDLIKKHPPVQSEAMELPFKTITVPFNEMNSVADQSTPKLEPELEGNLTMGLSKDWIDWYRNEGKGHSLMEARDEGLRRLAERRGTQQQEQQSTQPEPPLQNEHGHTNLDWLKWYRATTGTGLREARDAYRARVAELNKQ